MVHPTAPEPVDPAERAAQRREGRALLVAWAVGLLAVFGCVQAWIQHAQPANGEWVWAQMLGLATLPGKYVIFSGVSSLSPLGPWGLCLLAIGADLVVALTLAVGLGALGRVPVLGPALRNVHGRAEHVLAEFPRLRRMAFWGVVVFVFLPLPASGSVGGTFVGQLLGLTRTLGLVAVMVGGGLVSVTFAALANVLGREAETLLTNPWVSVIAGVVFLAAVALGWKHAKKLLRS